MKLHAYLLFATLIAMLSSCSSSENISADGAPCEVTIVVSNYMQTSLKEVDTRSALAPLPHIAMSLTDRDVAENVEFEIHNSDQEDYNIFRTIVVPGGSYASIVGYGEAELQHPSPQIIAFADGSVPDVFAVRKEIDDKDLSSGTMNVTMRRVVAAMEFHFPEEMLGRIASFHLQSGCGAFDITTGRALESYPRDYDRYDLTNVSRLTLYTFLPVPAGQQCQLPMTLTVCDVSGKSLLQWNLSPTLRISGITRVRLQCDGTSIDDGDNGGDNGDGDDDDDDDDDEKKGDDDDKDLMYYFDHLKRLVIPIARRGVQGVLGD